VDLKLKAECDQLNLAHETNTNERQLPSSQLVYRFKIREDSPHCTSRRDLNTCTSNRKSTAKETELVLEELIDLPTSASFCSH